MKVVRFYILQINLILQNINLEIVRIILIDSIYSNYISGIYTNLGENLYCEIFDPVNLYRNSSVTNNDKKSIMEKIEDQKEKAGNIENYEENSNVYAVYEIMDDLNVNINKQEENKINYNDVF